MFERTLGYREVNNRIEVNDNRELDNILENLAKKIMNKTKHAGRKLSECCKDPRLISQPVVEAVGLEELEDYMKKCRILFVNTYTTHCPYCMMFEEVFYMVADRFKGKAGFIRVNLEKDPRIAYKYYIMSTPTTIVIVDKKPIDLIIGYVNDYTFTKYIETILRKYNCNL